MVDTLPRHEPTLIEFLTDRARRASDTRLVLNAGFGLIGSAALAYWRPPGWISLLCLAMTFGAYGVWAITDRELVDGRAAGWEASLLEALRGLAAVAGALAGLGFVATLFGIALGTVIS